MSIKMFFFSKKKKLLLLLLSHSCVSFLPAETKKMKMMMNETKTVKKKALPT